MLTGAIGGRSKADTREPKTLFSTCQKRQRGSANLDQAALGGWATPSRGIVFVDDLETASDHDVALNGLNLPLASSCALADASARRRPPRRSYSLQLTAYGIRLTRYCRRLLGPGPTLPLQGAMHASKLPGGLRQPGAYGAIFATSRRLLFNQSRSPVPFPCTLRPRLRCTA